MGLTPIGIAASSPGYPDPDRFAGREARPDSADSSLIGHAPFVVGAALCVVKCATGSALTHDTTPAAAPPPLSAPPAARPSS